MKRYRNIRQSISKTYIAFMQHEKGKAKANLFSEQQLKSQTSILVVVLEQRAICNVTFQLSCLAFVKHVTQRTQYMTQESCNLQKSCKDKFNSMPSPAWLIYAFYVLVFRIAQARVAVYLLASLLASLQIRLRSSLHHLVSLVYHVLRPHKGSLAIVFVYSRL